MTGEMRFESPEAEIKYLEQKILKKKQELSGREPKSVVREIIEDHMQQETTRMPKTQASVPTGPPPDLPNQVTMYVEQAFQRGLKNAVENVRATRNPYLIDAFHDALVDRFLDALRAKGLLDTNG